MKKFKTILSCFIALALVTITTCNVFAAETQMENSTGIKKNDYDLSMYNISNLPEYVRNTVLSNAKNAVELDVSDVSNPYAITTINEDGTKTLFNFQLPIKYIENGKVLFKEAVVEKVSLIDRLLGKYEYISNKNDIKVYFPKNFSDGVLAKYKGYGISISPHNEYKSSSISTVESGVKYENVFSEEDYVEYIPLTNGVKENIILESYDGKNEFQFIVDIGELEPAYLSGESIPILDPTTKSIIMHIGQVDAVDSYVGENKENKKHFSIHNNLVLSATEIKGQYILTVVVDKEFLESKDTVYPVTIDPTISMTDTSRMRDTSVYSSKPTSTTFYTSSYNPVGYHGSSYGEGIAYIQILTMHYYRHINPNKINSAYYHVREGSGSTHSSVIEIHDTNATWNHSTINYNNRPSTYNYDSSKNVTVTTSKWYDFNITGLVKSWLKTELDQGGWNQTYGFALKAQNPNVSSKHFCSSEHATYPPSLVINYTEDTSLAEGTYYIKNVQTGKYLDAEDPKPSDGIVNVIVYKFFGHSNQQWRVKYQGNGYYKLYSNFPFFYNKCLDVSGDNIDVCADNTQDYLLFRLVNNNDGTYRIMPIYNNNLNKGLDVDGLSSSSGYLRNVINYTYHGADNQKWVFERIGSKQWKYEDYTHGSYVPQQGNFAFVNRSYAEGTVFTQVDFGLDTYNVTKILEYNRGESSVSSSNCYLTVDVTHMRKNNSTDQLSAVYIISNLPDYKSDIESDSGTRNEESEVVALGTVESNKNYYFRTAWKDYRNSSSLSSSIQCQFGMSKKGVIDYNNVIQSDVIQAVYNLGTSNGGL